ncbi:bifunctional diguanylate cyclase/phosphodiesterase [Streptomyces sp. NP160]|uniref:putative bifunctional diguanylate cyclase/phosphodiesterase n=1 Tax=Streptomyces sp. NP160 TaxID=2586637 RepID=UPI00111B8D2F|nr:bifunctional diguanylate cyclase/phosphodiesterase [Streptomyces sp. NP160]TNM68009.1 bifunctional diguanylate cyclase/phosphodiesterase [Streptomyces sp. NP160]
MRRVPADLLRGAALEARDVFTTSRPGVTAEVINRTSAVLFVVGAAVVLVGALVRPDLPHRELLVGFAAAGCATGAALHAARRQARVWHFHLTQLLAIGMITTGVVLVGGTHGWADAWLFAVVAAESVFFFPAAAAAVHLVTVLAGVLLALGAAGGAALGDLVVVGCVLAALSGTVRALARATETAGIDPLTRLPDRTATTGHLERALASIQHTGAPVVLVLLGMDHLQTTNQREGHAAGDALLRATAAAWRARLGRVGVLGRWGGDQFALVLHADVDAAWEVVEGLHAAVPEPRTASAGVVLAELGDELQDVIDRAEGALAAAKRQRRGSSHLWTPGLPTVRGLYEALADGSVEVHYQPVVRLSDGVTTGAEALVRWRRGDGFVPPADFLPQAEASGAVVQLGRYVLERACRDAASWPQPPGAAPLTVAVNASGPELAEDDYAAWVVSALHRSGLPGERLVVEVVEGLLDEQSDAVVANLHALRAAGVRIAVDDFGTGWSSLARLGRLPLDLLKVDRSFVADVEPGKEALLCAGVVALAHALDLAIVAEGVETEHQAAWLAALGCEEGQGWLWAPALTSSAFSERLGDGAHRLAASA